TAVTTAPKAKSPGPTREAAKSTPPRVIPLDRSQQAQAPAKPAAPAPATTAAAAAPAAPASQPSLAGAQPAVQANSFDSRWSTVR
ncbi:hypothetical protein J0S80_10825, partial [Streptococcus pneumoniae]|nr:hypothetical protein [Streptococcus pneumoniae]